MSQQVKVYYVENRATKEIRKFTLDDEVAGNFEYVAAKIRRAFPDLLRKDIDVFWKDEEEEYVTISSDDELYQALEFSHSNNETNGLLKLYVKVKPQTLGNGESTEEPKEHPGVTCDGCNSSIRGIRFKCTQCYDFDLCSGCESKNVHPSDHEMVCIKLPRTYGHFMRNPAFGRGNRRGPWGRGGPFRRCGGFGGRSPFGGMFHPFGFPPQYGFHQQECRSKCQKPKTEGEETSCPKEQQQQQDCNNSIPECVRIFASTLGIDPDVASDYFVLYFGEPKSNSEEEKEKSEEQKSNEEKTKASDAVDKDMTAENGVDFQRETAENAKTEEQGKTKDEDAPMEEELPTVESDGSTSKSEDKENKPELQNELEEMVGVFAKQFGLTPEAQKNIQGGLGSLLHGMFSQPFHEQSNTSDKKDQPETGNSSTEASAPEEFILVDQEKEGSSTEPSLTEDEKYQQRLEKALKQMEAMGFDNDNGWLKQLLISKDLSIGRVLDSLNPSV